MRKILVDKHIGWLDVAVHDAARVDVVECVGDLAHRGQAVVELVQLRGGAAVHQLHCEPPVAAAVHRDHVRMVEPVGEIELPLQSCALDRSATVIGQHLERDRVVRFAGGVRTEHGGGATVAQHLVDDVALERPPRAQHSPRVGRTRLASARAGYLRNQTKQGYV